MWRPYHYRLDFPYEQAPDVQGKPEPRARSPHALLADYSLTPVNTEDLRDYQATGAQWLRRNRSALLADEPGLGKTAQVLRALPPKCQALVVCPAHLRLVWLDECARWRPDLYPEIDAPRTPKSGEIVIASFDSLPAPPANARNALLPGENFSRAILVFDEAHYAKNYKAARTKRARLLARQFHSVWALTGTPLLGRPQDLWGVLSTAGLAFKAFGSWQTFCDCFQARKKRVKRDLAVTEFGDPLPEVRERLAQVMLRRVRADVLGELPPAIRKTIRVPAPDDLRELLDSALDAWTDPTELPPFEVMSAALAALAKSRVQATIEHVKSALEEGPLVVFSAHRAPILALANLHRLGIITGETPPDERAMFAKAFQAGQLDGIAGTIDAMGTGLTLTRGTRMLFVDEDYTPGKNQQARDRCLRIGQTNSVLIETMVSDHPLDVRRQQILALKEQMIAQAIGTTRPESSKA